MCRVFSLLYISDSRMLKLKFVVYMFAWIIILSFEKSALFSIFDCFTNV